MGLLSTPPAYDGYQPVNPKLLDHQKREAERVRLENQLVQDLERCAAEGAKNDEDECCMTTRMCLPYLYRLSMAAIVGGTVLGVVYFATR